MPNPYLLCTLSPSLSLLFFFFFFFILSFHAVHSAFSTICEPVSSTSQCGNISIQYPFWIVSDAAEHCGYPGLGINCSSGWDYPILSLPNYSYSVTEINYAYQTLTLVDMEVAHQSCPRARHNLTMGSLPLNYNSADANLTFFFNCSAPPKAPIPAAVISCLRFGDNQSYVFVDMSQVEAAAFGETLDCQDMVVAAVKRTKVSAANVVEEFAGAMNQGFVLDWEEWMECSRCERSGGRCAFNRMEIMQCFCDDGSNYGDRSFCGGNGSIGLKVGVGGSAAAGGFAVMIIIFFIWRFRQRKTSDQSSLVSRSISSIYSSRTDFEKGKQMTKYLDGETKIEGLVFSRRYTYKDVEKMTNLFNEKLGQGGYGSVYKGKLRDGQLVAVKLLKKLKGDAEEFFNEVASISRTSHVNVVSLLGYCFEGSKRALVYEFMPNGSLEKFIFNRNNALEVDQQLSCDTLYQISLGIALGLEYLHKGCNTRILHFDIKPHNILLDTNYCPKISDFGLAKICPRQESIVSMLGARGTPGYIAPELIMRNIGGVSHKSDVYSYGMMILEMVDRKKNIEVTGDHTSETYFPYWVNRCLKLQEELGLHEITNEEDEVIIKKMVVIGLWCIQIDPRARPCMTQVVEMLKGSVDALQIPPKPSFSSPSRSLAICPSESSSLQERNDSSWDNSLIHKTGHS